jgi:hypothetical protein
MQTKRAKKRADSLEPTRRKFSGDWDRADYYYHKILCWFYVRRNRSKAARFCDALGPILKRVANKHEAIMGEECWSLIHEIRGDLAKAISYRRSEIRLVAKLLKISPKLDDWGPVDLANRWILLSMLYKDSNQLQKAIVSLKTAKRICAENQVRFGSADLLGEYEDELGARSKLAVDQSRQTRPRRNTSNLEKAWSWRNETI